jgi:hypothetical protein
MGFGLAVWLFLGAPVRAQRAPEGPRVFVNVNVGAQPTRHTLVTATSVPVYEEPAVITSTLPIRNGALFDATVGYRVRPHLGVAIGFSTFGRPSDSAVSAAIPDPVLYGRPTTATASATDLAHRERALHLQAIWFVPVNDRLELAFSAGPSLIHVSQEMTPTVTVDANARTISATRTTESGFAKGVNAGVSADYLFTPRLGFGLFVRYAAGNIDLPSAGTVTVGGAQTGFGLRLRF